MGRPRKWLPRRTPQDDVNALISWYERHAPGGGPKMIAVNLDDAGLDRFAERSDEDGIWNYRGRKLQQVRDGNGR